MEYYKKINMRFVHASILLSTIASASGFSFTGSNRFGEYIGYAIGGVNVVIGLLNSFQRFGKAAEKTEMHGSVAMQYGMLFRLLDTELRLSEQHQRADLIPFARQEMDRLFGHAPNVPQCILDKYDKMFGNVVNKPELCDTMSNNVVETPRTIVEQQQMFANQPFMVGEEDKRQPLIITTRKSVANAGLEPIPVAEPASIPQQQE